MAAIKQIYTDSFRGDFNSSYRIIFLPEGYTTADESLFYQDMIGVINRLERLFPMTILEATKNKQTISCYFSFMPSANFGYANSSVGISGRTVFETFYESGQFHVNEEKINQVIESLDFTTDGDYVINIKETITKGTMDELSGVKLISDQTLLVILLPDANRTDIELEVLNTDTYYNILTSSDVLAEQVVLRALCKLLQLGDEFDLDGPGFLEPDADGGENIQFYFPNLLYAHGLISGPNPSTDETFKWRGFFNSETNSPVLLHPHPHPNMANRALPNKNVTFDKLELFEGGGGFRKGVYRSAEDCLMRRRIGDTSLPLKENKMSFCPVCKEILSTFFNH